MARSISFWTNNELCSSEICFEENTCATYVDLLICISSIPTECLIEFDEKLKASLERIIAEGINMDRMAGVLSRNERQVIKLSMSNPCR